MRRRRGSTWGGVAGPILFIGAWLVGGAIEPHYSPVHDAISELAAVGASVRPLMTIGFAAFAVGMLLYAGALRAALAGRAWLAAVGAGIAVGGVLAFPLGASSTVDHLHGAFAIAAYLSLIALPLLAARSLAAMGQRRVAGLSVGTGIAAGLCLAGTAFIATPGLLQRIGLTLVDAWVLGSAVGVLHVTARPRS